MTTEINTKTATEWLENHYKGMPRIWEEFDEDDAAANLVDAMRKYSIEMCGRNPAEFSYDKYGSRFCIFCGRGDFTLKHWRKGDYDDLPLLDLMVAMAESY